MRIPLTEIAKEMGIPVQGVRVCAQQGKFPFITAIKMPGSSVYTYYADKERFELWKKGELRG